MTKFIACLLLAIPLTVQAREVRIVQLPAVCASTTVVLQQLRETYKETAKWFGIDDDNTVMVLWANDSERTYTLTKTNEKSGVTCVVSTGKVPDKI